MLDEFFSFWTHLHLKNGGMIIFDLAELYTPISGMVEVVGGKEMLLQRHTVWSKATWLSAGILAVSKDIFIATLGVEQWMLLNTL